MDLDLAKEAAPADDSTAHGAGGLDDRGHRAGDPVTGADIHVAKIGVDAGEDAGNGIGANAGCLDGPGDTAVAADRAENVRGSDVGDAQGVLQRQIAQRAGTGDRPGDIETVQLLKSIFTECYGYR